MICHSFAVPEAGAIPDWRRRIGIGIRDEGCQMNRMRVRIRWGIALILAVCALLPLYVPGSCTVRPAPGDKSRHAWDVMHTSDPLSCFVVPLLFLWPVPVLSCQARCRQKILRGVAFVVEPLAAYFSAAIIAMLGGFFAEPRIGAQIAVAANAAMVLTWIVGVVALFARLWKGRWRRQAASAGAAG